MTMISGKVKRRTFDHCQIHYHNSLLGQVRRAEIAMRCVYDAQTTTDETRKLASKIEGEITVLYRMLKTRRDQEDVNSGKDRG